jgi:hypothetical protein
MSGSERIDDIIDLTSTQQQVTKLLEMLATVDEKIKQVGKITVTYTQAGTSSSEFKKQTDELIKANTDMVNMQKALSEQAAKARASQDMFNRSIEENAQQLARLKTSMDSYKKSLAEDALLLKQGVITRAEYNKRIAESNVKIGEFKLKSSELTSVLKTQQKQQMALTGSMDEMSQRLNLMKNAYRALSEEQRNSATGKELLNQINVLDEKVKELDGTIGNHQRHVGNYAGTLTSWSKVLMGLRGPTKLFAESLGLSAFAADQLRLAIEHGLQGLAAYFRAKEANTVATEKETAAAVQSTEAEVADATAHEATAAAMTSETVAAEATTVALGEETVAAETATVATTGLGAAIYAVLLPLALIGAAIALVVSSVYNWVTADKQAAEAAANLAEANQAVTEDLKQRIEDTKKYNELRLKGLQQEIDLLESQGVSTDKLAAKTLKLRQAQKHDAQVLAISNSVTEDSFKKITQEYEKARNKVAYIDDQISKGLATNEMNRLRLQSNPLTPGFVRRGLNIDIDIEDLKEKKEQAVKHRDALGARKDLEESILTDLSDAKLAAKKQSAEKNAALDEENRKYRLKNAETTLSDIKDINQRIIIAEESGLQQKLAAFKKIERAELSYITSQQTELKNDPKNRDDNNKLLPSVAAELKALEHQKKRIKEEGLQSQKELIEKDTAERYAAEIEKNNNFLQANIDHNKRVLADDKSTYAQKLAALAENIDAELAIETNNYNLKLSRIKKTDPLGKKQKENIEVEYKNNKTNISENGDLQKNDLAVKNINDDAKKAGVKVKTEAIDLEMERLKALHNEYKRGKVSLEEYNYQRSKLKDVVALESLKQYGVILTQQRENYLKYGKDVGEIDLAIAENKEQQDRLAMDMEDKEISHKLAKNKKTADEIIRYTREAASIVSEIMDNRFTAEKNAIQDVENAQQISYQKDVQNIEKSSASEQDKANKLKILEANRQAQKEANAREQKKIDIEKAKFDKAQAILNIILNTASAIVAQLSIPGAGIPLAAAAGAIGAAQLAVAASAPLPKYAKGREGGPAEWALTDENGPELYIEPDGSAYLGNDKPTMRFLSAGTRIIPAEEIQNYATLGLFSTMSRLSQVDTTSQKIDELKDLMAWQTNKLASAYSERRAPVVNITNQGQWNDYINRSVKN